MKEQFISQNFKRTSKLVIRTTNDLIKSYGEQGYSLTLRQLYYQFVAKNLFPEDWFDKKEGTINTQKNYKKLGDLISHARLAGLVDWEAIKDITRSLRAFRFYDNPSELIESCKYKYVIDKWINMDTYIEVWVEKDALIEVVEKAADVYERPCFSCRGYVSQSAMYNASKRLIRKQRFDNKKIVILHLGDHDPSGIDMSRDISDRLKMFMEPHGCKATIKRIALTINQVKKYNPPPNPAKTTDSRFNQYVEKYGYESWELDALEPSILHNLIVKNIEKYLDKDEYKRKENQQEIEIKKIVDIARELKEEEEEDF